MATNPNAILAAGNPFLAAAPAANPANPAGIPAATPAVTNVSPVAGTPVPLPGGQGRPDFRQFIPPGLATMLSQMAAQGRLADILQRSGLVSRLNQFGLTPDQIQAPGFDPSQLYTRQMAKQDFKAGNPLQAPGMVPAGYVAPTGGPGNHPALGGGPVGLATPAPLPPTAGQMLINPHAPIGLGG